MHPALEEIDVLYRPILIYHPHLYLSDEEAINFLLNAGDEYWNKRDEASQIYRTAIERFSQIVPELTPSEIIDGFNQGSMLLQANLGGYMYLNFNEAYLPTMIHAVRENHPVGYLFLGALSRYLGKEIVPLVIEVLDSKLRRRIRDTAIGFIHELEIMEAIPKLKELLQDSDPNIAEDARNTLEFLEGKLNS